jgi:3-dehydroquinate dehydratase-2
MYELESYKTRMSTMTNAERTRPLALVVNGPNLNLLGTREPGIYGASTLGDLERDVRARADALGWNVEFVQSNHEGALIDAMHSARERADGVIINPAGFTHTSVAIGDAIVAVGVPTVEVHISNIFGREQFRHHSYVSPVAIAVIAGAGTFGYELALELLARQLEVSA